MVLLYATLLFASDEPLPSALPVTDREVLESSTTRMQFLILAHVRRVVLRC